MSKNYPRCSVCGNHLLLVTDAPFGMGRIDWVHDGPCIKPERPPVIGYCSNPECERPVYGIMANRRNKILWCSEECRQWLAEKRRKEVLEAGKKYKVKRRVILAGIKRRNVA